MDKLSARRVSLPVAALRCVRAGSDVRDVRADYVRDGLVFWLDGIDKGGAEDAWTDLAGGVVFENHGAERRKDCWSFGGSTAEDPHYMSSGTVMNYPSRTCSIEVCFRCSDWSQSQFVFGTNVSDSVAAGYMSQGLLSFRSTYDNRTFAFARPAKEMTVTASAADTLGIANGVVLAQGAPEYWAVRGDTPRIGWRTGMPTFFTGELYSIRIYDRLLAEHEIRHNQRVDQRRFGFALTEPVSTLELGDADYEAGGHREPLGL